MKKEQFDKTLTRLRENLSNKDIQKQRSRSCKNELPDLSYTHEQSIIRKKYSELLYTKSFFFKENAKSPFIKNSKKAKLFEIRAYEPHTDVDLSKCLYHNLCDGVFI